MSKEMMFDKGVFEEGEDNKPNKITKRLYFHILDYVNQFNVSVLKQVKFEQLLLEAKLKFKVHQFCVSIGLDSILKSSLNDHTLSILKGIVYIKSITNIIIFGK